MYKIAGVLSLFAMMPISAAVAATAFGGGSAPTTAPIYNAEAVVPLDVPAAQVAAPAANVSTARAAANGAGNARAVFASPRAIISGSFGVSPAGVNAPVYQTNTSGGTTTRPTTPVDPTTPPVTTEPEWEPDMTIPQCMSRIESCVNSQLPGGIRNMFDENMRTSILNGANYCQEELDACKRMVTARVPKSDGSNDFDIVQLYHNNVELWVDFNSRVIQPQYYTWTLQRTGLTPRQAEGVCKLLDRNTFGSSFAAVGETNKVTTEYNQNVNAYNDQTGASGYKQSSSDQPMGADLNKNRVDANRGYYARWDAEQAVCEVRVAAYNGDNLIHNNWGGAHQWAGDSSDTGLINIGTKEPAEVWKLAGDNFKCNSDLFPFNLFNSTKTAALWGTVGGAGVGAGIGALAANASSTTYVSGIDCNDKSNWKAVAKATGKTVGDVNACKALQADNSSDKNTPVYKETKVGTGALIGTGVGAVGGLGLAAGITYALESQAVNCRVGDNLEKVAYNKDFTIPTIKDFYVKWALKLQDERGSMPLPIMSKSDWTKACTDNTMITDEASCTGLKVNYRREGLIQGMVIENACSWTVKGSKETCGINMVSCLSQGICSLSDVQRP
ncbi:MAG: hypothetical protein LBB23_01790 [Rickettsiales bacterium]|jgi:hypothetical protein|nr:hypothetical protein [Rickettsiales bacterium]